MTPHVAVCRVLVCVLAGGYLLRYVMVMAGRASADDPHATFALTRSPRSPDAPAPPRDRERP